MARHRKRDVLNTWGPGDLNGNRGSRNYGLELKSDNAGNSDTNCARIFAARVSGLMTPSSPASTISPAVTVYSRSSRPPAHRQRYCIAEQGQSPHPRQGCTEKLVPLPRTSTNIAWSIPSPPSTTSSPPSPSMVSLPRPSARRSTPSPPVSGHFGIKYNVSIIIAADKRICAIRSNYDVVDDVAGRVIDTVVAEIKLDVRQTVIGLIKDRRR